MDSKIVQRYKTKSIPQLIKIATVHFNKYIRQRDEGKGCVSCGAYNFSDAGHFYSAGHYPNLRFNEDNVHGQCKRCNLFLSGNLNEYRKRIPERIGDDGLAKLDDFADIYKRTSFKQDRFTLINIIETYKKKNK